MPTHQAADTVQWHLAGTAHVVRRVHPSWLSKFGTSNCLKVTSKANALPAPIRSAMTGKRLLASLELTLSSGKLHLTNAKIVESKPDPKSHDILLFSLTFEKIDLGSVVKTKTAQDDWTPFA
jgi:hypothetical protein